MKLKKELSSLEIMEFVKELKQYEYAYLDKLGFSDSFMIRLHSSEKGKAIFVFDYPYVYLTKQKIQFENKGFAQFLKKYVDNFRIEKIFQLGSERIFVFDLSKYFLVFELFYGGDIVFLDKDKTILRDFNKTGGSKKEKKYLLLDNYSDYFNCNFETFYGKLKQDVLVKSLARMIGGVYAEELCYRLGIDKKTEVDEEIAKRAYTAFHELLKERPCFCYYPEQSLFSVRKLSMYSGFKQFKTFSDMITNLLNQDVKDQELEKLDNAIKMQEQGILKMKDKIASLEKDVETIYSNYPFFDKVLKLISKSEKNPDLLNEVNALNGDFSVKNIDKKNKLVEFERKNG